MNTDQLLQLQLEMEKAKKEVKRALQEVFGTVFFIEILAYLIQNRKQKLKKI
jgi:hypothetical protein